ncbi:hypothetical protein DIPPA_11639 [Diplonema papillatum]|nr:hypothetical protein DIPPA_11639 [Diplonema papillatum]
MHSDDGVGLADSASDDACPDDHEHSLVDTWVNFRADLEKRDVLGDSEGFRKMQYYARLEHDAKAFEKAARESSERLRLAHAALQGYKEKCAEKKRAVASLRARVHSLDRDNAALRAELKGGHSAEDLARRLAEMGELLVARESEVARLRTALDASQRADAENQAQTALESDELATERHLRHQSELAAARAGHDRDASDSKLVSLQREVAALQASNQRLHQLVSQTTPLSLLGAATPSIYLPSPRCRVQAAGAPTQATSHRSSRDCAATRLALVQGPVRNDRPIVRKAEADYWVPQAVFTLATAFFDEAAPKLPADACYEFLAQVSKAFRLHYTSAMEVHEAESRRELARLKQMLRTRKKRVDKVTLDVELKDLKRALRESAKGKQSGYVGRATYDKHLSTAVCCLEDLVDQVAALELENEKLARVRGAEGRRDWPGKVGGNMAFSSTSGLLHHLRSLSSELAHVAEALLDDLRRAVDSVSPRHTSSSVQRITADLSSRVHEFFHSVTMALDSYDATRP